MASRLAEFRAKLEAELAEEIAKALASLDEQLRELKASNQDIRERLARLEKLMSQSENTEF